MERRKHTRRENQRSFIHKHINYIYDLKNGYNDSRVFQGVTINSSPGGMCLYIYQPVRVGDGLKISQDMFSSPQQWAIVRWVQEIDSGIYKTGLMYVSDEKNSVSI